MERRAGGVPFAPRARRPISAGLAGRFDAVAEGRVAGDAAGEGGGAGRFDGADQRRIGARRGAQAETRHDDERHAEAEAEDEPEDRIEPGNAQRPEPLVVALQQEAEGHQDDGGDDDRRREPGSLLRNPEDRRERGSEGYASDPADANGDDDREEAQHSPQRSARSPHEREERHERDAREIDEVGESGRRELHACVARMLGIASTSVHVARRAIAACASLLLFASSLGAQESPGATSVLATLRFDNAAETRPVGLVVSTAVPFAPGRVRDVATIGLDAPGEVEALERHGDGSLRWVRVRCIPSWKGLRATFVELRDDGARPRLPDGEFGVPPPIRLVLEDLDGIEREGRPGDWTVVEESTLRSVWRADGAHVATPGTGGPDVVPRLLQFTVFLERFRGAAFSRATVVLRNDPLGRPTGALRVRSYRLELEDPTWRAGLAWAKKNGSTEERVLGGGDRLWLLPRGTKDLWLGDGQTKAWRCVFEPSGDAALLRALVHTIEHPFLPGLVPAEIIASRAWGDLGDMVLGPPPATAAQLASAEAHRAFTTREYGWSGPWGDVRDTHQTGSPRNGLSSDGVLRSLQTGLGTWFDLTWERATQQALRPLLRDFRAADHPGALLFEGMPHPKWPDRLGREQGPDPRLARFRDGTSGGWRTETHGWNGFDEEHFTVDDLYAVHLLTGDPWVRFELQAIGQALLTYRFAKEDVPAASARADGWVLRGLVQLHRALGDPAYLEAAARLVRGLEATRGKGPMRWLHELPPDPRQLVNHPFEMVWQVAIAVNGLAAYHEATGDALAKRILLDAADFLVHHGWDAEQGAFRRSVATDGSGLSMPETGPGGTQSWIASALVAAHRLDPKPEYAILAEGIHRPVAGANATFERGGLQWTWWQSFLRWKYDRERASAPRRSDAR